MKHLRKMPPESAAGLMDYLKSLPQYVLPLHALTAVGHWLTRIRNRTFKNLLIDTVIRLYGVDLSEARESNPHAYPDFNSFFTRPLRPGARPVANGERDIASPVDGVISQAGAIEDGRIFQAKGHDFSVRDLLGGSDALAARFAGGRFMTIYLSPRDYHRIHMPRTGRLTEMVYVPGRLFGVGAHTTRAIPGVFARNERVAAIFETDAGPMALVLVGAMFVASIETVWAGVVTPPRGRRVVTTDYRGPAGNPVVLERGQEAGRFNMGSTVIVLFARDRAEWTPEAGPGARLRMGQRIGTTATEADVNPPEGAEAGGSQPAF